MNLINKKILLTKIISYFFLIFSLFLLINTIYKSEFFWNGDRRNFYFIYYAISFVFIFFSFLSFLINYKFKIYSFIILLSIIFALLLSELYLTLKEDYTNSTLKTKLDLFNEMKKYNKNIAVMVQPYNFLNQTKIDLFPLSGISNSKTILCNESGEFAIYKSDRFGFNNPDIEWDNDRIEFLIVGDSFAHGACVNPPNDIASVLRNLSKYPVLNLGYSGNGALIEYATLREFLPKKTKNIIWLYFEGNDTYDTEQELKNGTLINYIKNDKFSQKLKSNQIIVDKLSNQLLKKETLKKNNKKNSIISFFKIRSVRQLIYDSYQFLPQPQPAPSTEFKKILELAKKLADNNNSKFYFVYLPEYRRYEKNINQNNYNNIKKIISELNIHMIDIHLKVFDKEKNPLSLFYFKNSHYNIDGYRKVAETIFYETIK